MAAMQKRIETLQQEQVETLKKSAVRRLTRVWADSAFHGGDKDDPIAKAVNRELSWVADGIEEALDALDYESVNAQPGQRFDATIHSAGGKKKTGDQSLDLTIKTVKSQGIRRSGAERIYLPAEVVIWTYDPALDAPIHSTEPGENGEPVNTGTPIGQAPAPLTQALEPLSE